VGTNALVHLGVHQHLHVSGRRLADRMQQPVVLCKDQALDGGR
jgi:hypothetical protein